MKCGEISNEDLIMEFIKETRSYLIHKRVNKQHVDMRGLLIEKNIYNDYINVYKALYEDQYWVYFNIYIYHLQNQLIGDGVYSPYIG
jgi:hypothetical protein